jgi:TetR/AcrR family transcriptional regulator
MVVMAIYPKFYSLEREKQERIINAALKEFAKNGYEKASTNEIVKEAGISKGSLFNYFHSKKELYLFLLGYAAQMVEKIYAEVDWDERDCFQRLRQIGLVKLKVFQRFPQAFNFLLALQQEDAPEVKAHVQSFSKNLISSGFEKGYRNIDWTKFRDDVDREKMLNIINWTLLGIAEVYRDKVDSVEDLGPEVLREAEEYFEILRRCFYKME